MSDKADPLQILDTYPQLLANPVDVDNADIFPDENRYQKYAK